MKTGIKARYIFGSLLAVMALTIALSFFMNTQFIQSQVRTNLIQEIEFTRDIYRLKLLNLMEANEELNLLFPGDHRSSNIQILLYNDYGKNIGGNITRNDEGINNIRTMMLNGIEDTLYENHIFYSFTHVKSTQGDVYLMLEMSDQKYRENIRNYYFRTILIIVLVSVSIILIGYKMIESQSHNV